MNTLPAHARRRVREAINLNMKVRLLADTPAEFVALKRAISDARESNRVTAGLASALPAVQQSFADQNHGDVEQALRDAMKA